MIVFNLNLLYKVITIMLLTFQISLSFTKPFFQFLVNNIKYFCLYYLKLPAIIVKQRYLKFLKRIQPVKFNLDINLFLVLMKVLLQVLKVILLANYS